MYGQLEGSIPGAEIVMPELTGGNPVHGRRVRLEGLIRPKEEELQHGGTQQDHDHPQYGPALPVRHQTACDLVSIRSKVRPHTACCGTVGRKDKAPHPTPSHAPVTSYSDSFVA